MVEERLAVSQVGVEIEIGFAIVAQTHKPPWHSGLALDLLVSRFAEAACWPDCGLPEVDSLGFPSRPSCSRMRFCIPRMTPS
jgi:hypothetical protein